MAREAASLLGRAGKLTDDSIGVTVNTVTPGYISTEMVAAVPEKVLDKIRAQIPLGRLGRPEGIAQRFCRGSRIASVRIAFLDGRRRTRPQRLSWPGE